MAQFPSAWFDRPCFNFIPCLLALDTALITICFSDEAPDGRVGGSFVGGFIANLFLLLRGIFFRSLVVFLEQRLVNLQLQKYIFVQQTWLGLGECQAVFVYFTAININRLKVNYNQEKRTNPQERLLFILQLI